MTTNKRRRTSSKPVSYAEDDASENEFTDDDFESVSNGNSRSRVKVKQERNNTNDKKKKDTRDDDFDDEQEFDDDIDDDDDDDFEEETGKKVQNKKRKATNGTAAKKATAKTKAKTKTKTTKSATTAKKKTQKRTTKASTVKKPPTLRKLKELDMADRLNAAMQAYLWWEAPTLKAGEQWLSMEHAGVCFADDYEPHGIKMKYDGQEVELSSAEEEAATFFAAVDPEGMHLGNPKTAPIFIKNFFEDFRNVVLSSKNRQLIKKFEKCDFGPIRDHLNEQKIVKKAITDDERKRNKLNRQQVMFQYGYAIVDGHMEKVGNYNMEPPGTFRGRGEHPKMGKLKQRVWPEQVALNLSDSVAVPRCTVRGHSWGEVRHDPNVQFLAAWKENINNQDKYMQLAAQSSFKGKSDRSKYSKAARLCGKIGDIRASYNKKLTSKDKADRQMGTAMWVIDRLALRVGGEKDTDEEADTVGCCSLRVEHLHFDPNNEGAGNMEIELEFLGKDSMLFKQTIDFCSELYNLNNGMGEQVYKNLKYFCKKKKDSDDVFDSLTPQLLNQHLKEIMVGLTAKVFRTYNASKTLQDELRKTEQKNSWKKLTIAEKVVEYNAANREVAILCNHQKSVSKAQETSLGNISEKLNILKKQRTILRDTLKKLKKMGKDDKKLKVPLKENVKKMDEKVKKALEQAKRMKDSAKTNEEKIAASMADEKAKQLRKDFSAKKFEQNHLWDKIPTAEQVEKRIVLWNSKISKMELDLKHKDDNKEVSLGTSKINYMDPRISVAFCKRNEIPIEKIFSRTLRDKFNWAMAVPPYWEFNVDKGNEDSL
eukprot:CAMPEP_0116075842 /NCGR_PEP_ID=MMETSP0322-20121206/16875_1 /TAXON_ID=163516 /ORGANISM="Leptocylindrus danicus var. apora, Strain B651" /LENGTH=820 /DNA_ID=CAMNT_0003565977 /DNA_START=153 /DNA_END=2615 /DNA_ORIENTATION=-